MTEFIAQFHPLLVHFPIGFFLVGALFHILHLKGVSGITNTAILWILGISFGATLLSSLSGFLLADGGGYDSALVTKHRNGGIGLLTITAILFFFHLKVLSTTLQNLGWILGVTILTLTGHWGGSLTHGEDFLSIGSTEYVKPKITDPQQALVYQEIIEPIFAEKCWSCHSSKKQKGDLRLDTPEAILNGGESGKVLTAHKPDESDLYKRLLLDNDEHMPPDGKPQLTKEEIILVEWWISEGLSFDKKSAELKQTPELIHALQSLVHKESSPAPLPDIKLPEPDETSIKAISNSGFTISKIAQNSNFLSLSSFGKGFDELEPLVLQKLEEHIVWLKMTNQSFNQDNIEKLSSLKNLSVLDLRRSSFTDQSELSFEKLTELRRLNLSHSNIALEALLSCKALEHLSSMTLSGIEFSEKEVQILREQFPKVRLEFGGYRVPTFESDTTVFTQEMLL
ncbi:c-type cytochrome domain-containing protein [Jiulongibacter sp. NS-SX5]|uniref:c-type cytochrome domain-containing protein n=1 Tax=Jiulongibacter sp. NS-SX5 TaxID=3463854 RepID=UPI00405903D1